MTDGIVIPAAEAVVNSDGEVALVVPKLEGRPTGWREEDGSMVRISFGGGASRLFGVHPDALFSARARSRMLLVQVDGSGGDTEAWLPDLTDSAADGRVTAP